MRVIGRVFCLGVLAFLGCGGGTDVEYVQEIDTWHSGRIERLRSETGWLTLVGLHSLKEGINTLGSGEGADVRLIDKAAAELGVLGVEEGEVMFAAAAGIEVTDTADPDGGFVSHIVMASDSPGPATVLQAGSLVFHIIDREGRLFLRVKDRESEVLANFTGIDRYPVKSEWRVAARLEGEPGTMGVPNVLGQETQEPTPGELVFELEGKTCRLKPTGEPGKNLFIVFGDATNGKGSYPGGRFLYTDPPAEDGTVVLDFNKAYNPPCVFTPYATCPLPIRANVLDVAVTAGERAWGDHH